MLTVMRVLVLAALFGALMPVSAADVAGDAIAKAKVLLGQLKLQPEAKEFARVANEIGPVIDEVRQAEVSDDLLLRGQRRLGGIAGRVAAAGDRDRSDEEKGEESRLQSRSQPVHSGALEPARVVDSRRLWRR